MIKRIIQFFTPKKWTTVWKKPTNGWYAGYFGTQRNVSMVLKLRTSDRNTYQFILSDGDTSVVIDSDLITTYDPDAQAALNRLIIQTPSTD